MAAKKLMTEADVTMTGCLNALKKLRNCPTCEFRHDKEACRAKKCVPRVVIDRIELAVRDSFYKEKMLLKQQQQKKSKEAVVPEDTSASADIERLRI